MKSILTFVTLLSFIFGAKSQEKIAFKKLTDSSLIYLLNNVRDYKLLKGKDQVVSIFLVSSGKSASANFPSFSTGSDEISESLYIAVSEYDDSPEQSLFILDDIFGVTELSLSIKKEDDKLITLSFSYFDRKIKTRKKYTAQVNLNGFAIVK